MAWFKKADWPQPVTIDRVEQVFKHNNLSYTRREDGITAMIDGFFLWVTIPDGKALDFGFRFFEVPLTEEALPKAQRWAKERNLDGTIGTFGIGVHDDGEVYVSSQHAFLVTQGATDEQLAEFFQVGIQAQLDNLEDFVEEFGIERQQ